MGSTVMRRTVAVAVFAAMLAPAGADALPTVSSAGDSKEASRVRLRDGTGDVWTTPNSDEADYRLAPALRNGDIITARLAHRHRAITVRVRYAELRRMPTQQFGFIVRTGDGDWFSSVTATRRRPTGRMALWQPGGDRATCARMSHRIDYDANLVTMRLPRACVRRPDCVRLLVESYWITRTRSAIDNPHNHRPHASRFSRRLHQP
jgi:hypothetical protein